MPISRTCRAVRRLTDRHIQIEPRAALQVQSGCSGARRRRMCMTSRRLACHLLPRWHGPFSGNRQQTTQPPRLKTSRQPSRARPPLSSSGSRAKCRAGAPKAHRSSSLAIRSLRVRKQIQKDASVAQASPGGVKAVGAGPGVVGSARAHPSARRSASAERSSAPCASEKGVRTTFPGQTGPSSALRDWA